MRTSTHSQLYFQLEEQSINEKTTDDDTEHAGRVRYGLCNYYVTVLGKHSSSSHSLQLKAITNEVELH